jgi:hypothetical protein
MPFSKVPSESKKSIDRAGQALAENVADISTKYNAMDLANRWRACHAYPINTFQSTLRDKVKLLSGDPIVAQRLKRMPTIIDKLIRYPAMKLTTMQDIGGVRAVVETIGDVYKLANEYKEKSRFAHELIDEKDYIQNPRSEDGYRSVHLIYKYKNLRNPQYDGLRLELQIRTKLQHVWATAVETMGTFLGQALKSRRGDQDWLDFFAMVSSAFAYEEKQPAVPRYDALSREELSTLIIEANKRLDAIGIMRGISLAADHIIKEGKGWSYHLIVLNSLEKSVEVSSYDRDGFEQANMDYLKIEKEALNGKKIEPVLVSAGSLEMVRKAYPNFFLDIRGFIVCVTRIVKLK